MSSRSFFGLNTAGIASGNDVYGILVDKDHEIMHCGVGYIGARDVNANCINERAIDGGCTGD